MKKAISYCIAFLFLLLSSSFSFAQTIQSGNSSATSKVETTIEGSGNVQTHIETSANGVTKTLDASSPGTYKVEVNSSGNSQNLEKVASPSSSIKPVSSPKTITISQAKKINIVSGFKSMIIDFFEKIFNYFSLNNA